MYLWCTSSSSSFHDPFFLSSLSLSSPLLPFTPPPLPFSIFTSLYPSFPLSLSFCLTSSSSCCEARTHRLPSCTYPITQHLDPEEKDFCPPPPRLSLQDAMNRTASGRLDSDVVYMDELLMRIAHDMTPAVFTRRLVGGFVVSHKNRDPPYTVCGCMDTVKTSRDYFSDLALCKLENTTICKRENTTICKHENTTVCKRENTTVYLTPWNNFANTMYRCDTASRLTNFSLPNNCSDIADDSNLRDSLSLASGYEVDGTSADILNGQACSAIGCPCECDSDRPVASYFQSETNASTVATVWYNNRVRRCVHVNVFITSQSALPINET